MGNTKQGVWDWCKFYELPFLPWTLSTVWMLPPSFYRLLLIVDSLYKRLASQKILGFEKVQFPELTECWGGIFLPWRFPAYGQINSRWIPTAPERGRKWGEVSLVSGEEKAFPFESISTPARQESYNCLLPLMQAEFYVMCRWAPFLVQRSTRKIQNKKYFCTTYFLTKLFFLTRKSHMGNYGGFGITFDSTHLECTFWRGEERTAVFKLWVLL